MIEFTSSSSNYKEDIGKKDLQFKKCMIEVYQTNVKNLMDRKETQYKCIERGECSKITVENN